MKKLVLVSLVSLLTGCAFLQKHEDEFSKIGAAVACAIQKEEFDDETVNEACDKILGHLTSAELADVHQRIDRIEATKVRRVTAPKAPPAPACPKVGGS